MSGYRGSVLKRTEHEGKEQEVIGLKGRAFSFNTETNLPESFQISLSDASLLAKWDYFVDQVPQGTIFHNMKWTYRLLL
jgi:hypothetical protein